MSYPPGTFVVVTGSGFTSDLVGRQIWKPYDVNGEGGGRAWITQVDNSTTLRATTITTFDNLDQLNAGQWALTTNQVTNLYHLEGQTVQVIEDGGVGNDQVVTNGTITLDNQVSTAFVGLKYTGTVELLNIDSGGERGPAEAKPRNIIKAMVRFLNSIGTSFGSSYYRLEKWLFRDGNNDNAGRPVPPFSGIKEQTYSDEWQRSSKTLVFIQDQPLPCTINSVDMFVETSDE